eukprot:2683272-Amphidinium_carterae.1
MHPLSPCILTWCEHVKDRAKVENCVQDSRSKAWIHRVQITRLIGCSIRQRPGSPQLSGACMDK